MIDRSKPVPERPSTPFSRPFEVAQLEDSPLTINIVANESELSGLAAALGIPAISAVEARLILTPSGRGGVEVTGEVRGRVTQTCVVTLEPFESEVIEPVEIRFASQDEVDRAEDAYARRRDDDPTGLEMDEPPDAIVNGRIDLGAVAAEFLALGLDPYPRKPGVEFSAETPETADEGEASPFAALAKLRNPGEGR